MNYTLIMRQPGQILLILLLVMAIGLGVGISVIQRSVTNISTASKVEQSSRAFSAAEAAIEKALQGSCTGGPCVSFDNLATASIQGGELLPYPGEALEYPPISKESVAQFWLADPSTLISTCGNCSINVYWGNATTSPGDVDPALEVTVISGLAPYSATKYFLDKQASIRNNGFDSATITCPPPAPIATYYGSIRSFFCSKTISLSGVTSPILLRARILYSNADQPIAVAPVSPYSLPSQAKIITSTGQAGSSKRTVQLFTEDKVVPFFFDFAIFSAGDISK